MTNPRVLCYRTHCGHTARYQALRTGRNYCPDHAAEIAAIVPLRDIDPLTIALAHQAAVA